MHAARQTRIKASHRAHDVNALEFLRPVFFEDGSVLYRILVRPRSAVNVAWIRVPGCRRIGMVVGDLALADHHVMREHAAYRFVEAATNGLLRNLEISPSPCPTGMQFLQRPLRKIKSRGSRINLEVSTGAIALDRIAPLGNLPFKLNLRLGRSFWQVHFYALPSGLDVPDVHNSRECRRPKSRDRTASGIQRQMVAGPLIQPPRRHDPGIFAIKIALLRTRDGC